MKQWEEDLINWKSLTWFKHNEAMNIIVGKNKEPFLKENEQTKGKKPHAHKDM